MKWNITIASGAALLLLIAGNLQAQTTNLVTITATATVQNPNTADNQINTTTPAPTTLTVDTKKILALLAVSEGGEGNYTNTTFPSGAKLVLLPDTGNGPIFAVLGKTNNVLISDVSDILTFTAGGTYQAIVQSGKINDNTQLSNPSTTNQQIVTITYDDTSAGGNLQFSLSGVDVSTVTDVPVKKSTTKYLETESDSATGMSGDGNDTDTNSNVNPLVITGSFTALGSATLPLNQN